MSKGGEKLIEAAQSGIGDVHFQNPFTGKMERYVSERTYMTSMLRSAAERINELQDEVDRIKAHLVID
ncbi:hypothetical protein [Neorhizobium sp. LjRoot104]|uniref:hypothetical protein n=1 Tax=Neorhizobium sp. LjRoot104 TaxID=3342254 RepID=UPI003ECFE718